MGADDAGNGAVIREVKKRYRKWGGVAGASRVPDGRDGPVRAVELGRGHGVPLEVQAPVEAPPDDGGGAVHERVGADDVDDGAHHRAPVPLDRRQQRLQPHLVHLAVAVQEDQHLPCRGGKRPIRGENQEREGPIAPQTRVKYVIGSFFFFRAFLSLSGVLELTGILSKRANPAS